MYEASMDLYLELGERGPMCDAISGGGGVGGGSWRSCLLVDVLVIGDVPDDLLGSHQLLSVVVGDLKTELILHGHNDFDVVQGIKTKVVDKVRLKCHLVGGNFIEGFAHGDHSGLDVCHIHRNVAIQS